MKITKSELREIIQEELEEGFFTSDAPPGTGPEYSVPKRQKKVSSGPSVDDAEKSFIDSVIKHKYKILDYKEQESLTQRLILAIDKAIDAVLDKFSPTTLQEEAPPGMEDKVKALKKKLCDGKDDCPQAFKIAWSEYKEKK